MKEQNKWINKRERGATPTSPFIQNKGKESENSYQ